MVSEKLYRNTLNHLEVMSDKRKMEKKNKNLKKNTMSYEKFDCMEMLNSGTLAKQRVCVLDAVNTSTNDNLLAVKGKNKPQKVKKSRLLKITYAHFREHTNKQTELPQCGRGG